MSEPTPKDPRGPTNLRIKFRSANLDQFIARYAVDVSRGGIFIRTREPLAVGTRLKLEFQLQDTAPLLAGEGTVVWIRENDPSRENVTPGMGVRFDKLTPDSQPTLEKILAEKTRLEQAGVAPTGPANKGGGMAVRRPSGVFASLETNARAVFGGTAGAESSVASGPESTPIAVPPAPAVPAAARRPVRRPLSRVAFGRADRAGLPRAGGSVHPRPHDDHAARPGPVGAVRAADRRRHRQGAGGAGGGSRADAGRAPDAVGPALRRRRRLERADARRRRRRRAGRWSAADPGQPRAGIGADDRTAGRHAGPAAGRAQRWPGRRARRPPRCGRRGRGRAGRPRTAGRGAGAGLARSEQAVPRRLACISHAEQAQAGHHQPRRRRDRPRRGGRRRGQVPPPRSAVPAHRTAGARRGDAGRGHPARGSDAPPRTRPREPAAPEKTAPDDAEGAGGSSAVAAAPAEKAAAEKAAAEKPAPEKTAARRPRRRRRSPQPRPEPEEHRAKRHPPQAARRGGSHEQGNLASRRRGKEASRRGEARRRETTRRKGGSRAAGRREAGRRLVRETGGSRGRRATGARPQDHLDALGRPGADRRQGGRDDAVPEQGGRPGLASRDHHQEGRLRGERADGQRPRLVAPARKQPADAEGRRQAAPLGGEPAAPAAAPAAPKENAEPEDTGGPYIKEIKPDSP